jgi:multiple sugar transport system substrate-binding protein
MEGRKKRLAILVVMAAAFAAVIAGTAGARVDAKSAGSLNIYGYGPGDDTQENRAVYAAKQLPNLDISRPAGNFDDQKFLTMLASGQVPDLVRMPRPSLALYAAKGVLQPVDQCVKGVASQYRKGAMRAMTYKGHIYGLPEFTNQVTLLINADDFKAAGLPISAAQTTNMPKLLATTKKLVKFDGSGNLTRIGFDPKIDSGFGFPLWVKHFGADIISKNGLQAKINSKQAVLAMTWATRLINAQGGWSKFKAFRDTFDFFGKQNPIVKDQMSFWPMESFIYNVFSDNSPNINLASQYFTNQKGGPITFFSGTGWAIPKGSGNASGACDYMKAVTSVGAWLYAGEKRLNARKAAGRTFTGNYTANTVADKKTYEDIYQSFGQKTFDNAVKILVNAPKYGFELPPTPAGAQFSTAYNNAVQRILTGQQSIRAALNQAQKEAQAAINANK